MFGSKGRRGQQLLTPQYIQNLRRTYSNTNTSHFFQTLLETNQMTYLDPNKTYCMIKTHDYMKLKEELKKRSQKQQTLQKQVIQLTISVAKLSKQVQVYKENLERQRQNEQKLIEQLQNTISREKQLEAINYNLQKKLQERNNSFYSLQSRSVQSQKNRKIVKNTENIFVQTQIFPSSFAAITVEKSVMECQQKMPNIDQKQKKLYQLLQSQMNKFQAQFEKKITQLQENKQKIEHWEEENHHLRKQNEALKQKMFERNIQQEKLNVWRNTVSSFVSKVEMTMFKPKPSLNIEEIGENSSSQQTKRLKNEIIELRARIVEMKSKMKKIDEVMIDDREIADEGVIGKMLQLSQRIKSIVKGMIVQVQIGQI